MPARCVKCRARVSQQRGATLLIAMIMVLVLTLIALTAIDSSSKQTRMVSNSRDRIVALQAAEMGLVEAETLVETIEIKGESIGTNFSSVCDNGLCFFGSNGDNKQTCALTPKTTPVWLDSAGLDVWGDNNPPRYMSKRFTNNQKEAADVKTIVEFRCYRPADIDKGTIVAATPVQRMYRITALATAENGRGRVMVQSTYAVNAF